MIVTLSLKSQIASPVDVGLVVPSAFAAIDQSEMERISINTDGALCLGDLFRIQVSSRDDQSRITLRWEGDCSKLSGIGTGMLNGIIWVEGDVGDRFGARLKGGVCVTTGRAGDECGRAMSNGLLVVNGDCGDSLAGPMIGKLVGMRGGDLIVGGNVGERACERMRRGTVVIGGAVGGFGCHRMTAGTVLVMKDMGPSWCLGMKRGTLIATDSRRHPEPTSATFSSPRDFELSFLPILWKHLANQKRFVQELGKELQSQPPLEDLQIPKTRWVTRRVGDLLFGGRGEILLFDQSV